MVYEDAFLETLPPLTSAAKSNMRKLAAARAARAAGVAAAAGTERSSPGGKAAAETVAALVWQLVGCVVVAAMVAGSIIYPEYASWAGGNVVAVAIDETVMLPRLSFC